MKKGYMVLLCIALAAAVLSGCAAGNASSMTATAAPIVTGTPLATAQASLAPTMSPSMSPDAANGGMSQGGAAPAMTPAEAGRMAEQIAEAVERISEVDDAEVVISDNRALVAVEFDDQYKAGLDDRMKQMIEQAARKVDKNLTDVQITDDDTLYGQVKGLGERLMKATGIDELADDFGDLWNRITGM